ncbi:MAG: 50S ribosomal protein L21 [Armatimonadota bacterium]
MNAQRAPGNTCLNALMSDRMGTIKEPINSSKGCGGVMRVSPVGLVFRARQAFAVGAECAAITHGHPCGYLSAGALAMVVAELMEGAELPAAIATARAELANWDGYEETLAALDAGVGLAKKGRPEPEDLETLGGGWVGEEALAIALCAALAANDLPDGLRLAANHSGDTDSTAAIAGSVLGAQHGVDAIPTGWLDALELREENRAPLRRARCGVPILPWLRAARAVVPLARAKRPCIHRSLHEPCTHPRRARRVPRCPHFTVPASRTLSPPRSEPKPTQQPEPATSGKASRVLPAPTRTKQYANAVGIELRRHSGRARGLPSVLAFPLWRGPGVSMEDRPETTSATARPAGGCPAHAVRFRRAPRSGGPATDPAPSANPASGALTERPLTGNLLPSRVAEHDRTDQGVSKMAERAVFRSGGHQFHVKVGDILEIPRLDGEKGTEIAFQEVLLYKVPGNVRVGSPFVEGVTVFAQILDQTKGPKVRGFKYKPKKHYKRSFGHRQAITRVSITGIEPGGGGRVSARPAAEMPEETAEPASE